MSDAQRFADRLAEVDALTRRWRLDRAYRAALKLKQDFPLEPKAHTLFHLLVCLTDNQQGVGGGLFYVSPRLVREATMSVPGFENSMAHGDMLRDQLLGLVRFRRSTRKDGMDLARTLPAQIAKLHSGDGNRLACLEDARARLLAAEGDPLAACDGHKLAHQEWTDLPAGKADPNWVHFNLVHWLRTSIELWGRNAPQTQEVMTLLAKTGDAPGAHGSNQIRIIRLPVIGLRAYNWLETHRSSRP